MTPLFHKILEKYIIWVPEFHLTRISYILDQTYTVRSLLVIWLSCIDNGSIKDISTPRYLYNDEEGRKCILKKLDQFNHCDKVKQLSFLMYSFYSHSRKKSDEFVLQGTYTFQI